MKTFNVDIPEEQLEFVLELFDSLNFLSYTEAKPEPRNYIAKDYMVKKGLIPDENPPASDDAKKQKIDQLSELRKNIDLLQSKRQKEAPKVLNFRLPTSIKNGKASEIQQFSDCEKLKNYLESYLRIGIHKIDFKTNKKKALEMDNYQVVAIVKESETNFTNITAGFSDIEF
ncbi:hypothetical protein [Carboxylicivirga sp. N1Y90]|uniref:hypothetical protein n=1 Tax=Carboxylicivirga fragile TaxID=3417571 RepID=UPI003D346A75|nr:hypothetical protein [Marinilabiliaceae bacterium N1Y90]